MEDDNRLRVTTPIFLLRSTESCWRCHASQEVIALAFRWRLDRDQDKDEQPEENEPLILDNIHTMPKPLLDAVVFRHPHFEKCASKTAGTAYYMNTCDCGAHFGDFYLFSEPGGAFFPIDENEASRITIEELPLTGTFELDCSYGMGLGDLIFNHAKKLNPNE
jgi:hypothetical protein